MKVEQFFYALEIANTGSFSRAAQNLFLSQPNLSYSIRSLEEEIGFDLFRRTSTGVVATEEGMQLLEHFRVMQREYATVQELINDPSLGRRINLRVGTMDFGRSSETIIKTIQKYQGTPVTMSFYHYTTIMPLITEVEHARMDFGLTGILSPYLKKWIVLMKNRGIDYHALATVPICALVGEQNPLWHRDAVSLRELSTQCLIQNGSPSDDPTHAIAYAIGLTGTPHGEINVNDISLFYNTIRETASVGVVAYTPGIFASNPNMQKIRAVPIEDCRMEAAFGWIKSKRLPMSDIAVEVLQTLTSLF